MAEPEPGISPSVFLSYSSLNATFARKLDTALSLHGAKVFLDEREIRVGESIPDRVFGALAATSYLVYVVSQESIRSRWVTDEIGAARARQNETGLPIILPVVIDDCEVPPSVRHIRYADFRQWRLEQNFKKALASVLVSLHLNQVAPSDLELRSFLAQPASFIEAIKETSRAAGILSMAHYSPKIIGLEASEPRAWIVGRGVVRRMFLDQPLEAVRILVSAHSGSVAPGNSGFQNFLSEVEDLVTHLASVAFSRDAGYDFETNIQLCLHGAQRAESMLSDIYNNYLTLVLARNLDVRSEDE